MAVSPRRAVSSIAQAYDIRTARPDRPGTPVDEFEELQGD